MFQLLIRCRESFTRMSFFEGTLGFLLNRAIPLLDYICHLDVIVLGIVGLVLFLLVHKSEARFGPRNFKFDFGLVGLILLAWR